MFNCRIIVGALLVLLTTSSAGWSQTGESSPAAVVERTLDEAGIDAAIEKFRELATTASADFQAAENDFLRLGEQLMSSGKRIAAIAILEEVIESYPDTWRAYSLLRDVYNQDGDYEQATRYFRAFLDKRSAMALEAAIADQQSQLATTAEQVINRCVEAMGGEEALRSLKTLKKTIIGFQLGERFGGESLLMAPNYVRREYGDCTRATVTNGIAVWSVEPSGWYERPRVWGLLQSSSITLDMLDYKAKGITYELIGTEGFEGAALYKLRKTLSNGIEFFVFFDITSDLLVMDSDTRFGSFQGNLFMDYREVAGVQLPHMKVRFADVLTAPHVAILEYEANIPLADELFVVPE